MSIASHAIAIALQFLGAWGSYKNNRLYLLVFAVVMLVSIVVSAFDVMVYSSLGFSLLVIILALVQAELIRRGHG